MNDGTVFFVLFPVAWRTAKTESFPSGGNRTVSKEINNQEQLQLFEDQPIRTAWDPEQEEWYFSIVDVVGVLTEQETQRGASNY